MTFCQHGSNFRRKFQLFWSMRSGRATKTHPSLPSTFESRRTKGHWAQHEHRKSKFGCQQCYVFISDSLQQFITKCDRYYYKIRQLILLQNATEIYYKMRQAFCYKMRQLLQNATFSTNCDNTNLFFRKIFLSLVRYIIALFKSLSIYGS